MMCKKKKKEKKKKINNNNNNNNDEVRIKRKLLVLPELGALYRKKARTVQQQ